VDPTPIEWTKPTRQDAKNWSNSKERRAKESAEKDRQGGGDEGGVHRRKRGLIGGRRRVEFPGRAATCSTKCRELWRRHLQVNGQNPLLWFVLVQCVQCTMVIEEI